ncbi:MAG: hypothetical protein WBX19_00355 [Terracidiphilus sp.]
MLNPNHWFVAYDRGSELRISAWSGHNRPSAAAARHLCGQKCLHKLVDGFMAKALSVSIPTAGDNMSTRISESKRSDASLASSAAFPMQPVPVIGSNVKDIDSSARLLTLASLSAERASVSPHRLHAEAWNRERERQRLAEQASPPRRSLA